MLRILRLERLQGRRNRRTVRPTRHAGHILALHRRAEGRYRFGDEDLSVKSPYLCLVVAGEDDANRLDGPFDLHYVEFLGLDLRSSGTAVRIGDQAFSHLRPLDSRGCADADRIFSDLEALRAEPSLAAQATASARILDLVACWLRPPRTARDPARLLHEAIRDRAGEDVAIEALCADIGGNVDHLRERFVASYGLTPSAWRTQVRLLRARDHLGAGASVAAAAAAAGWSREAFTRLFRRRFGTTPSAFRADRGHGR